MNDLELKDKIRVDKTFINNILNKSWLEVAEIQNQISNLSDCKENETIKYLLNNLLTNYYIFIGGLECLSDNQNHQQLTSNIKQDKVDIDENTTPEINNDELIQDNLSEIKGAVQTEFEPFEFLVDFDDPVGEKLTDEDLYG